jgi:hypothetical protein
MNMRFLLRRRTLNIGMSLITGPGSDCPTYQGGEMKALAQACFWLGILSIPASWAIWYIGPELGRQVMEGITDPLLKAALQEAHSERFGIYVGLWAPTLLILSTILEKKD